MKLNNKGWGLGVFLMFLLLFFAMLLIVANLVGSIDDRFTSGTEVICIQ
jgi:hypothetical protein